MSYENNLTNFSLNSGSISLKDIWATEASTIRLLADEIGIKLRTKTPKEVNEERFMGIAHQRYFVKQDLFDLVRTKLNLPDMEIFLFGSRSRFRRDKTYGDWDLALQYSDELSQHISKTFNLSLILEDGYVGSDTVDSFTKATYIVNLEGFGEVNLSLKKDLDLFKDMWDMIDNNTYWNLFNKRSENFVGKGYVANLLSAMYNLREMGEQHFSFSTKRKMEMML